MLNSDKKYDIDNLLREALKSDETPDIELLESVGAIINRPKNYIDKINTVITGETQDPKAIGNRPYKSRLAEISKNIARYLGKAVSVAVIILFVGGIGLAAWFLNIYTPPVYVADMPDVDVIDNETNNNNETLPINNNTDDAENSPTIQNNQNSPGNQNIQNIQNTQNTQNTDSAPKDENPVCYTFLILGVDKSGGPTDTMMIAMFNVKENTISILNIPRDLYVNTKNYSGKINGVYATKGIEYLNAVIKYTFGITIHKYAVINLEGFKMLVDKIGGVDFDVPLRMKYTDPSQGLYINLKAGFQHLDGAKAEQLIRFRHGDAGYADYTSIGYPGEDIGRIETRKRFLAALMKKMLANIDVNTIKGLFEFGSKYMVSDISNVDAAWFAAKMINVKLENIRTHTVPGIWISSVLRYEAYKAETIQIINKYYNPNKDEIPETDFNIYDKDLAGLKGYKPEIDIDGKTMDSLVK